jgi:co-chaperonin GroES (HSP10)
MTNKRVPQPFGSYVIVRPRDLKKYSEGKHGASIIIARANEERDRGAVTDGVVVAIGPLAFKDDMNPSGEPWYQIGDRVVFVKYGGKFITYDDELYIVFHYEDIMCRVEDNVQFSDGEKE